MNSHKKIKIIVCLGTRPEVIKLAPVIMELRRRKFNVVVLSTGQHREMLMQAFKIFGIVPDINLSVMKRNQTLSSLTSRIISTIDREFSRIKPDWVIIQGDTTTAFLAGLSAFYHKIRIAHVEAGLRTGNIYSPWPEELNRRLISSMAEINFSPTIRARDNLIKENVSFKKIAVTGNTSIDALFLLKDCLIKKILG